MMDYSRKFNSISNLYSFNEPNYDHYDYRSFWYKRQYENHCDFIALRRLLAKAEGKRQTILEAGSGFGRLTPIYAGLFNKVFLLDPSADQSNCSKDRIGKKFKNISYLSGRAENIPLKDGSADVIVCIRVFHHIPKTFSSIKEFNRILSKGGYLILEVANKLNAKSRIRSLLKGQRHSLSSSHPLQLGSDRLIPFVNHNPRSIEKELEIAGFSIISKRSVSNFRLGIFKKLVPLDILNLMENVSQKLLAKIWFGPSIYFLAKKL